MVEKMKMRFLEERVKFCFVAQNKDAPTEHLLGPISKILHVEEHGETYTYNVLTCITQEDIVRIRQDPDFKYA